MLMDNNAAIVYVLRRMMHQDALFLTILKKL